LPRSERLLLYSAAAVSLILRALAVFRYRFNSDEQQHLHVVWGWTAGMVPYRDFFDNHLPLFHLLSVPMLALLGERSDVLLWMRAPMLLLFAVVVWGTYTLGKRLFDERTGLWAAVLLSLFPPFFLKSLEYRNDNLWNALWVLALVGLVRGWRPFLVGLVLGLAFAASIKMLVLLFALVVAAAIARRRWMELLAGFVVVPAALAIGFASIGALDELFYCNVTFNTAFSMTRKNLWVGRALFPVALAAVLWMAWRHRQRKETWLYVFALLAAIYTIILPPLGVPISPRDFLPLMPMAAIVTAAMVKRTQTFAIIAVALVASLWYYAERFEKNTDWHTTMMDQALRLTRPGEMIIDLKGETIFRPRPFYYLFEALTRAQMARGLIRDTVPEDVIRTRTHVAQADGPLWPPRARAFLSDNFLNMGRLRASGQWLKDDGAFTIAVPGEYVIVSERGAMSAAREYAAGTYRFARKTNEPLAVMWAPAFRRGHSPFHLRDLEF
jgi:hypothetical protein